MLDQPCLLCSAKKSPRGNVVAAYYVHWQLFQFRRRDEASRSYTAQKLLEEGWSRCLVAQSSGLWHQRDVCILRVTLTLVKVGERCKSATYEDRTWDATLILCSAVVQYMAPMWKLTMSHFLFVLKTHIQWIRRHKPATTTAYGFRIVLKKINTQNNF